MPFGDKLVGYETEFQNTTIKQVYEKLQQLPFQISESKRIPSWQKCYSIPIVTDIPP